MTKQELIETFVSNHQKITSYINSLSTNDFTYSLQNKWSVGQQAKHILLTLQPFSTVLISKEFILEKFGKINRQPLSYKAVISLYLNTNLKSPEQFSPENIVAFDQKKHIIEAINNNLKNIQLLLNDYSEAELDTLVLPHPLLGNLTIKEMFYVMSYHALHHLKQIEDTLANKDM